MNHLNEINDNINELILNKSFDRLTEAEKIKALEYAGSEEEYNSLRQTLMAITSSFNEEAEEEFAVDEMKTDLMSQFEKKYGTSNKRTKVVPLYRKTYFQLAVAASLTLLVFISIPIFRKSGNDGDAQLALANKSAENKNEKTTTGHTGGLDNNTLPTTGMNKPDMGTAEYREKETVKKEAGKDAPVLAENKSVNGLMNDEQKLEKKSETRDLVSETKAQNTLTIADERMDDNDGVKYKGKEGDLKVESGLNQNMDNSLAKDKNAGTDVITESKKLRKQEAEKTVFNAAPAETEKSTIEYTNHKSDHTHDHLDRLNTMATSGSTVPSKNLGSPGVTHFVEQNKTQMLDLLFTVY